MSSIPATSPAHPIRAPHELRNRVSGLTAIRKQAERERDRLRGQVGVLDTVLARADEVQNALEELARDLFDSTLTVVEEQLTLALQEIFTGEPIALRARREVKRGSLEVDFYVERNGKGEDIMRGQGGSVLNILSVGLRMFALATQDPAVHRPFLVLDEQDCWLRPDLVPRFVKIVALAAKELGLQVLVISHHDPQLFAEYAERAYRFTPAGDHVTVREHPLQPSGDVEFAVSAAGALGDPTPKDMGHGLADDVPLRRLVESADGLRSSPLPLPGLEDHGVRLARLRSRPSVLQILSDWRIALDGADAPIDSALVETAGALFVDQAQLRKPLSIRLPEIGATLSLEGGSDRSVTYELSFGKLDLTFPASEPAALEGLRTSQAGLAPIRQAALALHAARESGRVAQLMDWVRSWPSSLRTGLETAATTRAQRLLRVIRETGSQRMPESSAWRAQIQSMVQEREDLENAAGLLSASAPPTRLKRALARLDEVADHVFGLDLASGSRDAPGEHGWWVSLAGAFDS